MRGSTFNGFLLLCIGMVLGAVLMALYTGYQSGDGNSIGSGLRDFIANKTPAITTGDTKRAESAPAPTRPKVDVEFHKRLADDEVVLAPVEPERVSAAQRVIDAVTHAGRNKQKSPQSPASTETVTNGVRIAQLQVGSFSKRTDAERMKAEIALKGFTASIESGLVEGREMWRVRLGPYNIDDGTLNQVREMLADNGLTSLEVGVTRTGQ